MLWVFVTSISTVWLLCQYVAAFHTQKWKAVNVKECQTEKLEEKGKGEPRTPSPLAHHLHSASVRQSGLCMETAGKKKLFFYGSDCFGLLLIAAKWKRLYNPGLCARSLLALLHWHFKDGSGAGQATHPSNKLSIMQCELNNRWPVREMSVQAPFDELWRGETESTSLSPDSSWYWVLSLIFHGSLQLESRT